MNENWYYVTSDAERVGPVSEDELNVLVACGQLRESALVWSESMTEWAPYSSITRLSAPSHVATGAMSSSIGYPVPAGLAGWLQFVGVMHIIPGTFISLIGVLSIITLIGPFLIVPVGVLLTVAGTACLGAGTAVKRMTSVDSATYACLVHIRRYMLAYGILFVAQLIMALLGIFMLLIAAASADGFATTY